MDPAHHSERRFGDGVLDLSWVHKELAPYYSHTGRPTVDRTGADDPDAAHWLRVLRSVRSGGSALRCRSIWPIAGSAGSVSKIRFPIIRCSAELGMNASAPAQVNLVLST